MAEEYLDNQFLDTPQVNTGLRFRVVRGGFWVFVLRITTGLFGLVRTIILARLLAPADFGVFGIALLAVSSLQAFSQTGFGAALVQKKGDTKSYLDTAWTVQVIRGVVLGLIAFALAPYVAAFFDTPAAKPILQVIAFSVLLGGFGNIGLIYFQKELKFHKTFIYALGGTLADIGTAIPAAFLLRSVWALVLGLLAGTVVRLVMSYVIHPYRPRLGFDKHQFKELFGFGKWVLGSTVVIFFLNHGDDAFLGKVLGVTTLGFYQLAFRFAYLPGSEIGVLSRVAFPAYSELQDNIPKLRTAYLKMLRLVTFLAIPLTAGIFALSPAFTQIFLGNKWMPMVPALRILAISSLIKTTTDTSGALFYSIGRPDIAFKMVLVRVVILAVTIYPLTMLWKMSGTSLAVVIAICAGIPIWIIGCSTEVKVGVKDYLRTLLPPLIGTSLMSAVIFTQGLFLNQFEVRGFLISVFTGIVTYFGFAYFSQGILDYSVSKDLEIILNPLRSRVKYEDEETNN